jgi:hypothetical protein
MLRSMEQLVGYAIKAIDGEIGKVDDFYFDDHKWCVRYLVDRTGVLFGRSVLISPKALGRPNWNTKTFPVSLTKEQVEKSPDVGTAEPVSRHKETELVAYFKWPMYWRGGFYPLDAPMGQIPAKGVTPADEKEAEDEPHLQSMEEVLGYRVEALDGEIGHVEDFIVDDEEWIIRHVVVNTRNWLPGKKVLLARSWIKDVSWTESRIYVDLERKQIKESPEFDPQAPVNRQYEETLYDFYGRPKYWR